MALLGTLVHQFTGAFTAIPAGNSSYATHQHSLPGSAPDMLHLEVVSYESAAFLMGPPVLWGPGGGNASVITVGVAQGSASSEPATAYKATAMVFHTWIR